MDQSLFILAIDPGNIQSAYVVLDGDLRPVEFGKWENNNLNEELPTIVNRYKVRHVAIEMIASYGMAVGASVFDTCVWIGRLTQTACRHVNIGKVTYVYRKDEKINLCGSMKAKDANIRQALIDRFGVVGVKKNPGWFYGVSKDVWAAVACGVTYHDLYLSKQKEGVNNE